MVGLDLRLSYADPNKEVVIVTARGYIDTTTSPDFSRLIEQQLGLGKYKFVMDLGQVDYISSTGWGVFIGNLREVRDKGGDIVLANMVSGVHNIFTLMDLSSILKDYNSLDGAIAYFIRDTATRRYADRSPTVDRSQPDESYVDYEKIDRRNDDIEGSREGNGISLYKDKSGSQAGPGKGIPSEKAYRAGKPSRSTSHKWTPSPEETFFALARTDLGRRILRVIFDYPYYEVKEIGKALKLPEYGWRKASQRAIVKELKRMDLMDKEKRYYFVLRIKSS
jgi:anti-sigma B factor antagonist